TTRLADVSLSPISPTPPWRFHTIVSCSRSSRIAERSGSGGVPPIARSPLVISRHTNASMASFFGRALASALSFADPSFPATGGNRAATESSVPIPPGHSRAAAVATAYGARNHEITQTTSAPAATTAATTSNAFFIVQSDETDSTAQSSLVRNCMRPIGAALAIALIACPLFAGFPGTDLILPAVGRVAGAGGSQFYTTVWVTNPNPTPVDFSVDFLLSGQANLHPASVAQTIAPKETRS